MSARIARTSARLVTQARPFHSSSTPLSPFTSSPHLRTDASTSTASTNRPNGSNPAMSFPCIDQNEIRTARLLEQRNKDFPLSTNSSRASYNTLGPASTTESSTAAADDPEGPEPAYANVVSGYQTYHHPHPFPLDYGGHLPSFSLAYETWGTLNADRSNAVLLHTGLSASSHAHSTLENPAEGWWEKFIGPGKALDTDRFFVICTNVLGGCYGSTGPSSLDPSDGQPYATRFPIVSIFDMVRAQFELLTSLGIDKLAASVGSSMGGMQSIAAAHLEPERVGKIVSISGTSRSSPASIAMRHAQRSVLMADPNWKRGFYYDDLPPHTGMKLARQIATITYRSGPEWEQRFGRRRRDLASTPSITADVSSSHLPSPPVLCPDFLIETYLDHQGEQFCLKYDANSLIYVSKAMDLFDMSQDALDDLEARKIARDAGKAPSDALCPVPPPPRPSPASAAKTKAAKAFISSLPSSHAYLPSLTSGLSRLRRHPTLVVGVQSDTLFPIEQQRELAECLKANGNPNVVYYELNQPWGHDTFLLDVTNVGSAINGFLSASFGAAEGSQTPLRKKPRTHSSELPEISPLPPLARTDPELASHPSSTIASTSSTASADSIEKEMVSSGVPLLGAPSPSNGHSTSEMESNGHSNGFAMNGNGIGGAGATEEMEISENGKVLDSMQYRGGEGFVPLWEGSNFDRREFVRLALQAFQDMGYRDTAASLQAESGFILEDPVVASFRQCILEGRWSEAEDMLARLPLERAENSTPILFAIRQQKFLEAMETQDTKRALTILRNDLSGLNFDSDRLHFLSSLVMCSEATELRRRAVWDGVNGESRRRLLVHLQSFISPTVMLPQRRLGTLLSQAQAHQQRHHAFPSSTSEPFSLLVDAEARATETFPSHTSHVLREHMDEVWRLAWSHNGEFLATAGKDKLVIIWSVKDNFAVHKVFGPHSDPVSCLAWSPDDSILLTASESVIKMWSMQSLEAIATLSKHDYPIGALAWLPNGLEFVSGGMDLKVYFWDLSGNITSTLPASPTRVLDLAVTPDGSKLVCVGRADTTEPHTIPSRQSSRSATPSINLTAPLGARHEKRISVYDLVKRELLYDVVQPSELTSVEISKDSKYAIVSHAPKEILYLELESGSIVRKFEGHDQGQFVLRSCFGGATENFVLSGSADGKIVVYHRDTGRLLYNLTGHDVTTVNAVAWNPDPSRAMWASCSDDRSIRIWQVGPSGEAEGGRREIPSSSSSRINRLRPLTRS
ncbi:uncharacterized protein JCM6883_001136 [Sporobolomyces salmoneus]|uniref:uncharacterized protein n=1 Tax=Sporobolomyces salmoneus TaxID=183962 RepID=UPI0031766A75